jgi:transposase, IS5 family
MDKRSCSISFQAVIPRQLLFTLRGGSQDLLSYNIRRLLPEKARANFLRVAKQKKPRRSNIKATMRRHLDYLQQNLDAIDALIASEAMLSGLKTHWLQKVLIVSELPRQQSILLYFKTRSMPDRIVSLVQRHVRPMVHGKARAAVELGAKISLSVRNGFAFLHRISSDPYNEAEDLIPQAKDY